ncbi:MAG: hypothetical protein OJF49_002314 [Ktedonobacterales bacterium]|jgi:hypothetical protein|nr:MAG: hypothetical protein OJF49_002314 [Ktedonobacterales bacterium]
MMTFAQTWLVVLGDGGLSSNVAVAAAALVVVLTIVLVFVMVLRSNSAGRKASSGLGYDAQVGPIGQPRNEADGAWQRQGGPASGGYDYGAAGQMSGARGGSGAGWGQDYADPRGAAGPNSQAQWGSQQAAAAGWGQDYATGGQQGAWGNQSSGQGAWGMNPAAGAGQPAWDAHAGMPSQGTPAPWDQGGAQGWGGQQGAAQPEWAGAQTGGAGGWGMGGAQQPTMGQDWGAQQGAQQWGAAGGAGAAYADMERTRSARPDTPQRSYVLVVQEGKEQGRPYELRKDRITIGRSRESDIFLEDLAVSRLHTSINREMDGRYLLRDEGSANGTYVNGQRVNEKMLDEGDEVQVGQTVLKFTRR